MVRCHADTIKIYTSSLGGVQIEMTVWSHEIDGLYVEDTDGIIETPRQVHKLKPEVQ